MDCCDHGPGYASPQEAMKGPREQVIFITTPHVELNGGDAICTVDVDPNSPTYCQVLCKLEMPYKGDEIHHSGWNICSSCHGSVGAKRTHLICPCPLSDRIYVINVEDPKLLKLEKVIEPSEIHSLGVSFPHTTHCLPDGHVMISTLGDRDGNNQGNFLLLKKDSFEPVGLWIPDNRHLPFGYSFWYQPRRNVFFSTEWGAPRLVKNGFDLKQLAEGKYGHSVHIFDWTTREEKQEIVLPLPQGALPFEIRFHHEPTSPHCFVGTALGSSVYHFYPNPTNPDQYESKCVISIEPKEVSGWLPAMPSLPSIITNILPTSLISMPSMPAMVTDILISMDDRYLYLTSYLHGEVRQYDITNPDEPKMMGMVTLGGSLHSESGVTVKDPNFIAPRPLVVKGQRIRGGPHMMQLSLDGRRLYVTMSLFRPWDKQFYPNLSKSGGAMLLIDVDPNGGMRLNEHFLIHFGELEGGPYLGHEMRYPGGDCTSDIWI